MLVRDTKYCLALDCQAQRSCAYLQRVLDDVESDRLAATSILRELIVLGSGVLDLFVVGGWTCGDSLDFLRVGHVWRCLAIDKKLLSS